MLKYAKPERERRFVLAAVPPRRTNPREIVDALTSSGRVCGCDR